MAGLVEVSARRTSLTTLKLWYKIIGKSMITFAADMLDECPVRNSRTTKKLSV